MTRGRVDVSYSDLILAFALIQSGMDVISKWEAFGQCSKPLHVWLLVSYAAMFWFLATHHLGKYASEDSMESGLPYLRQRGAPWLLIKVTWFLILPFFAAWTVLGTLWSLSTLGETTRCLPAGTHGWFILLWQVLCYAWTAIYSVFVCVALRYERSLNAMEKAHNCLAATEDALRRWGQLPFIPDYSSSLSKGLCQDTIESLPRSRFSDVARHQMRECAICLIDFQPGNACRELPGCGHVFHESCIDLWLLRCGKCPLCQNRIQA